MAGPLLKFPFLMLFMVAMYSCPSTVLITKIRVNVMHANYYIKEKSDDYQINSTLRKLYQAQKVSIEKYPFLVRLTFIYEGFMGLCGGTLIHPKYILTAKHCQGKNIKVLLVCMAEGFMSQLESCRGESRYGSKILALRTVDLLAIEVVQPFTTTSGVGVLTPQNFNENKLKDCYSLGWSRTGNMQSHKPNLRWANFQIISVNDATISGFAIGNNACKGYSGSPLVCDNKLVGVATKPECKFCAGVLDYVNLNPHLQFVNQVLSGQYDRTASPQSSYTLILSSVIVSWKSLRMKRVWLIIGLVLITSALIFGQDEDQDQDMPSSSDEVSTDEANTDEDHSDAIVKLYLLDSHDEVISSCSGVLITEEWIVSSGSCLKEASRDSQLKVCSDFATMSDPANCTGSTFAYKVIFPNHAWYNNIAFVQTDGSMKPNVSLSFTPKGEKPDLNNCVMMGMNEYDVMGNLEVTVRKGCRVGYYCVDDRSGWSCDYNKGSLLVCDGKMRGIYSKSHDISCQQHKGISFNADDHPLKDTHSEGEESLDPIEEDHWALQYFLSFDAYEDLIKKVLNGTYDAVDETEEDE